jgi:molecular chaperone DnaJ
MTKTNLYEILGLTKKATTEDIKKAYRKLAMEYHPDKTNGDKDKEELFKEISNAYKILTDPIKRKDYDMFGIVDENDLAYESMNDIFANLFSTVTQAPGGFRSSMNFEDIMGEINNMNCEVHVMHNMDNLGSTFENLFSVNKDKFKVKFNNQKNNKKEEPTASDINDEIDVEIDIDEIIDGNPEKYAEYSIYEKCELCDGYSNNISCECSGNGRYFTKNNILFKLQPGVKNGSKITYSKKGSYNVENNTYNNLVLNIKYNLPDNIKIKSNHLIIYIDLTLKEIFCGFAKTIEIGDKTIDVKINSYINPNEPIIYKNCGIPGENKKKGNIIIIPKIIYPEPQKVTQHKNILSDFFSNLY